MGKTNTEMLKVIETEQWHNLYTYSHTQ